MLHLQEGGRAALLSGKQNNETFMSQGLTKKVCLPPAGGSSGGGGRGQAAVWKGLEQEQLDPAAGIASAWHLES